MGYSMNSKAYRCYCPKTGRIVISRHVFFIESKDNTPCPFRPRVEIQEHDNQTDPFKQLDDKSASGGVQTVENQPLQENLPNAADANVNDRNKEDKNQHP